MNTIDCFKKHLKSTLKRHERIWPVGLLHASYRKIMKNIREQKLPLLDRAVQIAITYRCQCKCVHCGSSWYKQNNRGELNEIEIKQLIKTCRTLGAREICFFGGEPLLVKQLPDYIRHAKKNNMIAYLSTNGYLLTERKVKELKKAGIDKINVSIDSYQRKEHDRLRGLPGIFDRAINGINYCRANGVKCYMLTYISREILRNGDIRKLIYLAKSLGVSIFLFTPVCSGRWYGLNHLSYTPEEKSLIQDYLEEGKVFLEHKEIDRKSVPHSCYALKKRHIYISLYGDVQPCNMVPIRFGNIHEEPLERIVRRMFNSAMYVRYEKYDDCPMNSAKFRRKYCKPLESAKQYPVDYSLSPT